MKSLRGLQVVIYIFYTIFAYSSNMLNKITSMKKKSMLTKIRSVKNQLLIAHKYKYLGYTLFWTFLFKLSICPFFVNKSKYFIGIELILTLFTSIIYTNISIETSIVLFNIWCGLDEINNTIKSCKK